MERVIFNRYKSEHDRQEFECELLRRPITVADIEKYRQLILLEEQNKGAIPFKIWLDEVDEKTLEQAKNLANLPFAYKWGCLMADAHCGYGMPIGGVIATKGVVIPNAVGVDIGCGMMALKTPLTNITRHQLKKILSKIRQVIPTGFKHHKQSQDGILMPLVGAPLSHSIVWTEYNRALKQIGTLGGGNHFIEIQKGSDGHIWIMIHSGSRNLGYKVARHYNTLAKELNTKWFSTVPLKSDLAFLPLDSEEGKKYMAEMQYCVDFAYSNRRLMMQRVVECFDSVIENWCSIDCEMINIAHNYASLENHFGENVMVHRKGATLAREGTVGIIPGCQGSKSYIVRGKGNPESFHSCSHGAGRLMSRAVAKKVLSLENEQKKLDNKGILHSVRGKNSLDEAPGAYKDIQRVMELQTDLVDITVELEPLAVVKG
jgi:tRNA-splicing ligase RtcB